MPHRRIQRPTVGLICVSHWGLFLSGGHAAGDAVINGVGGEAGHAWGGPAAIDTEGVATLFPLIFRKADFWSARERSLRYGTVTSERSCSVAIEKFVFLVFCRQFQNLWKYLLVC
jgi:hypothetical protein